ncbi:MAG: transposase [Candidatus Thiodiazotropha sp. (ex Lucinoma aequizonata)]|nr:transposase [Candidatus Thiodiazotropha sp. (ex Lucinoma aequizonata)]
MWVKTAKRQRSKEWYSSLTEEQREAIESLSMDMWPVFINATLESLPGAEEKIAFDKFHVAKCLAEAVDKVHR